MTLVLNTGKNVAEKSYGQKQSDDKEGRGEDNAYDIAADVAPLFPLIEVEPLDSVFFLAISWGYDNVFDSLTCRIIYFYDVSVPGA